MNSPTPLFPAWPQLAKRMRAAPRRVLLSDFDGTLVGIRRMPGDVRLSKANRRLIVQIREAGSTVGVVSGRGIDDLIELVKLPRIWYVGSHGYDLRNPRGRMISLATPAQQRRVRRAAHWIAKKLVPLTGTKLDVKRSTLAVHYRAASLPVARKAEEVVQELLQREPGLRLLSGKKVWELLPGDSVDKWTAVKRLLAEEKATRNAFVVYLGDDRTDESIFRKMNDGVSVVVGRQSDTAALYSLRSLSDVRKFLKLWLEAEREVTGTKRPPRAS